jgi:hypothetical protein
MKKLLFIIALNALIFNAFTQTSGFMGKRLMLKTDAIIWAFDQEPNFELEYVANRRITLALQYKTINETISNDFIVTPTDPITGFDLGRIWASDYYSEIADEINEGGRFSGYELLASLKIFYKGAAPAPIGLYNRFTYGTAFTDVSGIVGEGFGFENFVPVFQPNGIAEIPVRYSIANVPHTMFGYGIGHQSVHKERFILDFGFIIQHRILHFGEYFALGQRLKFDLEDNIFPLYFSDAGFSSDVTEYHMYLKLGILLF